MRSASEWMIAKVRSGKFMQSCSISDRQTFLMPQSSSSVTCSRPSGSSSSICSSSLPSRSSSSTTIVRDSSTSNSASRLLWLITFP